MATQNKVNPWTTADQIYHELKISTWWLAIDHARSELGHHLAFGLVSGCQNFLRLLEDPPLDKVLPRAHEIGPLKIPLALLNTTPILDLIYNAVDKELRQHPLKEVCFSGPPNELNNYFTKHAVMIEQLPGLQINLTVTCYSGFKTELHDPVKLDKIFAADAMQRIRAAATTPTAPLPVSRRSLFP